MNYDQALAIAAEHAPKLIVDAHRTSMPAMFVVRKVEGGHPFSIHLPTALPNPDTTDAEKDAQEREMFMQALDAAVVSLGA